MAQDFEDLGERGLVGEICGKEGVNRMLEEMRAALVVEMEVYAVAYALMAGGKVAHSVLKKAVENEEALVEEL